MKSSENKKRKCHVILLAGGIGSRMKSEMPKQYLEVNGMPLFMYSFQKFSCLEPIDTIVFVIEDKWKAFVEKWIINTNSKKVLYAPAGNSRQQSVLNGLQSLREVSSENDVIFVHDSVRPLFHSEIIHESLIALDDVDAVLPVISVKDATYQSSDGVMLSSVLPRDQLFFGQSPEAFVYGKILSAHSLFTKDQIDSMHGSSELAFRAGMHIKFLAGSEDNIKITTQEDLYFIKEKLK